MEERMAKNQEAAGTGRSESNGKRKTNEIVEQDDSWELSEDQSETHSKTKRKGVEQYRIFEKRNAEEKENEDEEREIQGEDREVDTGRKDKGEKDVEEPLKMQMKMEIKRVEKKVVLMKDSLWGMRLKEKRLTKDCGKDKGPEKRPEEVEECMRYPLYSFDMLAKIVNVAEIQFVKFNPDEEVGKKKTTINTIQNAATLSVE